MAIINTTECTTVDILEDNVTMDKITKSNLEIQFFFVNRHGAKGPSGYGDKFYKFNLDSSLMIWFAVKNLVSM